MQADQPHGKDATLWVTAKREPTKLISADKAAYLARVEIALERAYKSAVETALQTNTYLVVQRDGQLLKLKANEL